ncbi:hypothetical protein [Paludisphaera rhizosphaerae]|uniref:hypothetical protein n=1 Tax=Paludisphaera rhizosphaerae TaxID=2711216 RepID=UPI0013ED06DB|nr:hypothetical protein [Paludisphaera rhizosphaerae]
MIAMMFIAFLLALADQMSSAELTESALRKEAWNFRPKDITLEFMVQVLGDRGIDVLKQATDVELLRVTRGSEEDKVVPTGVMLGEAVALRTASLLMDHRNYLGAHHHPVLDDASLRLVGLRFRNGSSILDVVTEVGGVWFRFALHDQAGRKVQSSGGLQLMTDPELVELSMWLSRQGYTVRDG